MMLKNQMIRLSLFAAIILSLFFNPAPALAIHDGTNAPNSSEFSKTIQNLQADALLREVHISNMLVLPITQQPADDAGYVSDKDGEVTQFRLASQFGNIGLLAHNHLAGKIFSQLKAGQEIHLVHGNGRIETFIVTKTLKYQALQSESLHSQFRSINGRAILSTEQMFKRIYSGRRHIAFQTCIEKDGNPNWGRLFVIAVPKTEHP